MCDTCGCNVTPGNEHLVRSDGKHAVTADGKVPGDVPCRGCNVGYQDRFVESD